MKILSIPVFEIITVGLLIGVGLLTAVSYRDSKSITQNAWEKVYEDELRDNGEEMRQLFLRYADDSIANR